MGIDTDAIRANTDIVSVIGSYVGLKKRGAEYVGPCPIHGGKNDNFYVSPAKKMWTCFSRGCHECEEGNDVIGFMRLIEGVDFKTACERLGGKDDWKPRAPVPHERTEPPPQRITSKPPADAPALSMALKDLGNPSRAWTYRDSDGGILGYVARYDTPEGKQIRCWTWGTKGDAPARWSCGHWAKPRPLYGLDRLAARPEASVLIVEGEKAADAAAALLPDYVVTAWPGGSQSWHKAGWEPLRGRAVLLWPDNDAAGLECMEKLAALLGDPKGLACKVRTIDPKGQPDGFDAADWTGTTAELIAWARPRATNYMPAVEAPPEPPTIAQDEPPPYEEPAALPKTRKRARLAVVGNNALAPEEDAEPLPAEMSEDYLSERFAELHGKQWRYVKPWSAWFQWRGDGWYEDKTALVDRLAVEVTRQAIYWQEAASLSTDAKRRVNSKRTAGAVRDMAMSHRGIAATTDQWDTDPWLLGVPGGVVDLRTGELSDAKPDQFITKRTSVMPQPGPAPIWEKFLHTVTDDNEKLMSFLQRFAGYSLTGETREQCFAFLYGTGQNGKGVFITTLARILGDYAISADADVFMETDQQRHPTEMARMRGARLVTVDETDNAKRWNEKRIKRITGGGKIEARFMKQDHFEFMPQFKLLLAGNHKPQLRGVGKAIQRRIHLVPFTVTIRDEDRDDELQEKLAAEYPQILQWMVQGCAQWIRHGLDAPPEVLDATSRYIESEDVIGEWLDERTDQRGETARPIAYKNYRAWMEGRGERPWSTKAFWAALEERGFVDRKSNGTFHIVGLSLRSSGDNEPPPGRYPD